MTMAISSDVDMKLDMSLDDIVEQGRGVPAQGALLPTPTQPFGKSRHNKRSDRLAQSVPYRNRSSRAGGGGGDSMVQGVNVHVSNLAFNVDWKNLKDYMRLAGNVVKASIMEDKGRSKGFGIVQFRTPEAAQHAIDKLNNTEFFGRTIYLRPDREEQRQYAASVDSDDGMHTPTYATGTRLYVGNLSWNVRWQDLKDHMKSAGTVKYADVMLEPSGRSKGCGLVEFSTPEEAQCAIDTLNDTELDGRRIFIREDREPDSGSISSIARPAGGNGRPPMRFQQSAHPHPPPPPPLPPQPPHTIDDTTALYVGNLAWNVKWQELKDLFRTVGEVDHAEVPIMPSGKSRGFGIVRYVYSDDAAEAINRLNGTEFLGRVIEVRYDRGRARP